MGNVNLGAMYIKNIIKLADCLIVCLRYPIYSLHSRKKGREEKIKIVGKR